jgi:ATP-binding cassette, subfamily B, bacterial
MSERFEEQEYNTDSLDTKLWSKILKLLWIHKKDLFVLYGFMIMLAFVDVAFPLLNRHAIDNFVIGTARENEVLIFCIGIFGICRMAIIQCLLFYQAGRQDRNELCLRCPSESIYQTSGTFI